MPNNYLVLFLIDLLVFCLMGLAFIFIQYPNDVTWGRLIFVFAFDLVGALIFAYLQYRKWI